VVRELISTRQGRLVKQAVWGHAGWPWRNAGREYNAPQAACPQHIATAQATSLDATGSGRCVALLLPRWGTMHSW